MKGERGGMANAEKGKWGTDSSFIDVDLLDESGFK